MLFFKVVGMGPICLKCCLGCERPCHVLGLEEVAIWLIHLVRIQYIHWEFLLDLCLVMKVSMSHSSCTGFPLSDYTTLSL